MPVRITADPTQASGFKIEIGYSDTSGNVTYVSCINNVTACMVAATCMPGTGTDQVSLTINGNAISGTIARTVSATSCTVNFDFSGTRQ